MRKEARTAPSTVARCRWRLRDRPTYLADAAGGRGIRKPSRSPSDSTRTTGRAAGEVASAITIETFQQAAPRLRQAVQAYADAPEWSSRNQVLELLDSVCQSASARVYEEAEHSSRRGMTTTLVVVLVGGGAAFLAHVGDSRAYLVRDGLIRQLTEDHSMVNDLVRSGQMTWEEARRSRYRSVITRAIGLYPNVQADLMSIEILPGDRILINSDGLSDPVPSDKIEEICCRALPDCAQQPRTHE